jgi:hypothetical protein
LFYDNTINIYIKKNKKQHFAQRYNHNPQIEEGQTITLPTEKKE